MNHSKLNPPNTLTATLESEIQAVQAFLSETEAEAERAAADCLALQAAMTSADWAELDAALDGWLVKRSKDDLRAA